MSEGKWREGKEGRERREGGRREEREGKTKGTGTRKGREGERKRIFFLLSDIIQLYCTVLIVNQTRTIRPLHLRRAYL